MKQMLILHVLLNGISGACICAPLKYDINKKGNLYLIKKLLVVSFINYVESGKCATVFKF